MKKMFRLLSVFLILSATLSAQKVYYVYLQSDNQQPFYVRLGEKIYNSNPIGYLILSNLRDSSYVLNVGFQGTTIPDQPFSVTVNKKDQGYLLKNFIDKGWGLFNLTTLSVQMPMSDNMQNIQVVKTEKREGNPFTDLLAKAADDSTIKEKPVLVKNEEIKTGIQNEVPVKNQEVKQVQKDSVLKVESAPKETEVLEKNPVIKKDSVVVKPPVQMDSTILITESRKEYINKVKPVDTVSIAEKKETIDNKVEKIADEQNTIDVLPKEKNSEQSYVRSEIKLHSESSTTTGVRLVFLDQQSGNNVDTIRILVPAETKKPSQPKVNIEEKKFLDMPVVDTVLKASEPVTSSENKKCIQTATDQDFFELRRNMAGEIGDDNMISRAKKAFASKCFSTAQIRNLGALFLTDEGKYRFFDNSYQSVSDPGNFPALQSELKDEYFINRFKAMIRQ